MPTFKTPEPIAATIELIVGDARIIASDRDDTVVDVRPADASHEPDVRAAGQTRVEYAAGRLLVKTPKPRTLGLFGKPGSVDVTVELPSGSRLDASAAVAGFRCVGRLGESRIKTSAGDVDVEAAASLDLHSGVGAIVVDHVTGDADISTGSGKIRVREIDGNAVIKNSNGDCWIGQVKADLRVKTANGDIDVDHAHADVIAATAMGDVRIGEVVRGSASLKTAFGQVEVGIRTGSAARLDVHTSFGRLHNQLDAADSPGSSDETVAVNANTSYGDIVIRRADAVQ